VAWEIFESVAAGYEGWYATRKGHRVDQAERALLDWLFVRLPAPERILEIGCGTGHFTRYLASRSPYVVGLDRSPAMLAAFRGEAPQIPAILGEAHRIPLRDGAVDAVTLITVLEFLDDPVWVLAEAIRVSRRGLVMVCLNPWSLGGLSRRIGPQARQPILGRARDRSLSTIRSMAVEAAGNRLESLFWTSGLLPGLPCNVRCPVAMGGILGVVVGLYPPSGADRRPAGSGPGRFS
jgi:SAM-dependent methyltransferase